jgi:hypothetical protein
VGEEEGDMSDKTAQALVLMLLLGASAQGYQWASRYDGPGHGADRVAGLGHDERLGEEGTEPEDGPGLLA